MRPGWEEYQVWSGRNIVSRHDTFGQARKAAEQRLNSIYDEAALQLAEIARARAREALAACTEG